MSNLNLFKNKDILVDMDSVLNNWPEEARKEVLKRIPNIGYIPPPDKQKLWNFEQNFPEEYRDEIMKIYFNPEPGFYYNMKPLPGAIEKLREFVEKDSNVFILTSPVPTGPDYLKHYGYNKRLQTKALTRIIGEKIEWFYDNAEDLLQIEVLPIHRKDKVSGHLLIDDKPDAANGNMTSWKQIYFNNNYGWLNGNANCQPQANWGNMIETIERIEVSRTLGSRPGFGSEGC